MKLYTRSGDDGWTMLFGGQRVSKDSLRVEAYGTVDELNSVCGLALAGCGQPWIAEVLQKLQDRLFEIGADLATPVDGAARQDTSKVRRVGPEQVGEVEGWIDGACEGVPPMRAFVLPGGTDLAARLHVARTVARRAERRCIALAQHEPVNQDLVIYLNRVSDLLFALARKANHDAGCDDIPWTAPPNPEAGAAPGAGSGAGTGAGSGAGLEAGVGVEVEPVETEAGAGAGSTPDANARIEPPPGV